MALGYCDTSRITNIAEAIKEKGGDSSEMTLKEMPSRIRAIIGPVEVGYTIYTLIDTAQEIDFTSYPYPYSVTTATTTFNQVTLNLASSTWTKTYDYITGAFILSAKYEYSAVTKSYYLSKTGPTKLEFKNCTLNFNDSVSPFYAKGSSLEGYLCLSYLSIENCTFVCPGSCDFFRGQSALTSFDLGTLKLMGVTNMNSMFSGCSSLTSLDLSNFNTSSVTSMYQMFYNCTSLTTLDLSNFNTSSVTSMNYMFRNCSSLTGLDVSNFNTSSVTDMSGMFDSCSKLTSLDLSNFNTSSVTNMKWMFSNCSSLTSLDLSSFNTSSVTDMGSAYVSYGMFYNCTSLTTLTLGENWASNSSITSLNLSSCPLTHDSCLDVFNKLATKTSTATLKLKSTTKALMSSGEIAIATNKGWTVS